MIRFFFPALGLAFPIVGAIAARPLENPRARICAHLSSLAGMLCFLLWWPDNSVLFDGLVHVTGLGRFISYTMGSLAFVLETEWAIALLGWTGRWPRSGLRIYWALVLVSVPVWIVTTQLQLHDLALRFNYGYYGRPWPLLALNVVLGLEIFWGCALATGTLWRIYRETPDRAEAPLAAGLAAAALVVSAFGISIVVQAWGDALGFGAVGLWRYRGIFVAAAGLVLIATMMGNIFLAGPLRRLSTALSIREQKTELWRVLRDLKYFLILLSERLVFLNPFVDVTLVDAITAECAAAGLDEHARSIAQEVGRWISFYRGEILSKPQLLGPSLTLEDVDLSIASDAWRRAEGDHFFYGDVYIIVGLLLGPFLASTHISQSICPEHHQLAALIKRAVATHLQIPFLPVEAGQPVALTSVDSLRPLLQVEGTAILPASVSRAFAAYRHKELPLSSNGQVARDDVGDEQFLAWELETDIGALVRTTRVGAHSHVALWWNADTPCIVCPLTTALNHLRAACEASPSGCCALFGVMLGPSGIVYDFGNALEADAATGHIVAAIGR